MYKLCNVLAGRQPGIMRWRRVYMVVSVDAAERKSRPSRCSGSCILTEIHTGCGQR